MELTLESLITPAGVVIAAGLITSFVELIKYVFPVIDAKFSGAAMALVFSFVLYVLVVISAAIDGTLTAELTLTVLVSWVSCATSAIGFKSSVAHVTETRSTLTEEVPQE